MLLHYDFLAEFRRQFYKDLLTVDNLVSGLIELPKLTYENEEEEGVFWGWVLEKNGVKYLVSLRDSNDKKRNIVDMLPIKPKDTVKVSCKGTIYEWINKPVVMRIKPEKTLTFKQLVDQLSSLGHTNFNHQRLMWFMALSQMMDRANYRISTPAGFGKDSTVDILGNLIGGSATLENPTLAKLEYMTTYSWLAINEVVDIQKAEWRIIEQFLLASGAHKPEITKHSRASDKTKEVLNISKFSISLMYNDIDHYPKKELYFDYVTKDAVLDRFPAFRLYGTFNENFNAIKGVDPKTYVAQHIDEYKTLIRNYTYYQQNMYSLLKQYSSAKLRPMPERWGTNVGRLLNIINMYSDTQEEYDKWIELINSCMLDYEEMLKYPVLLEQASKKCTPKEFTTLHGQLTHTTTFISKNNLLNNKISGKPIVAETKDGFWEKFN